MPQVKLADGSEWDIPDGPLSPEGKAFVESRGGFATESKLKDVGKAALSGLVEGVVSAPFIGADLFALGANGLEALWPGSTSEQNRRSASQQFIDDISYHAGVERYKPQTDAGRYTNAASAAVGGGILNPKGMVTIASKIPAVSSRFGEAVKNWMARAAQTQNVQNAGIGAAAEFGGDVSRGFDTNEAQNPVTKLLAGGGATLAAILAARMGRYKGDTALYQAGKSLTPEQIRAAEQEAARFAASGATAHTIADTLPANSSIRNLAREVSNEVGGQQLNDKLAGRDAPTGDISRLLNKAQDAALNVAAPNRPQGPGIVDLPKAAHETAMMNKSAAGLAIQRASPLIPRQQIMPIVSELIRMARQQNVVGSPQRPALLNAARTVYDTPTWRLPQPPGPGPFPATGVMPVTSIRGPTPPPAPVAPGGALPAPSISRQAPSIGMSPGLSPASPTQFGGSPVTPWQSIIPDNGPSSFTPTQPWQPITDVWPTPAPRGVNLEVLAQRVKGLNSADPIYTQTSRVRPGTPAKKLDAKAVKDAYVATNDLTKQNVPAYEASMQAYREAAPRERLAQLLMENKLRPVPNQSTSPLATDQVRNEIMHILRGQNPAEAARIGNKIESADKFSALDAQRGAQGVERTFGNSFTAAVMQFFTTVSRRANMKNQQRINESISNLLSDPTPQNYRTLEALTRNDPELTQHFRELANVMGLNSGVQTEGGQP